MIHRWPVLRRAGAGASVDTGLEAGPEAAPDSTPEPAGESTPVHSAPARWTRITLRRVLVAGTLLLVVGVAIAYPQRARFTAQGADFSRSVIGDENTARIESWYFKLQDRIDRTKYRLLGGSTNPFDGKGIRVELVPPGEPVVVVYYAGGTSGPAGGPILTADTMGPVPLQLPKTVALRENPEAGEGVWSTTGLPRSSPNDVLMARTFIRPDKARPYASVGVLLADSRRVRLHITGGTVDPGGDRGVRGPGTIPQEAHGRLLVAWNGGFKGPHGGYGMYADGKEYRPLRNGLASIAVMKDGTLKMGEWGRDLSWEEGMVAVRQNAVLLVDKGEVSRRVSEGNDTWGYVQVNSAEFITWRSAVGVTKDGHILVAAGNSLSAESLARALWAAGAYYAMQLDINSPYVLTSLFSPQPDGTLKAQRFMDSMPDSPSRYFKTQERDFMYLTLDESRYQ